MIKIFWISLLTGLIGIGTTPGIAQKNILRTKIDSITRLTKGMVGVAVMDLATKDTLLFNGEYKFAMQSVYKFPLAMCALDAVDKGKLSLNQKIHLTKADLLPNTHSPLRDKYPDGNVDISLAEILSFTVSQSDNNGCDILFRMLGGTAIVNKYVHSLGLKEIEIATTEEQMHTQWDVQFTNWCKPGTMVALLNILYECKHLSKASSDFLWKLMIETSTGPNKLKGLLPKGTVVAHKTGASGKNDQGITGATNDVGIIELPNGKRIAVVVYVTIAPEPDVQLDSVIAQIGLACYHYFQQKTF